MHCFQSCSNFDVSSINSPIMISITLLPFSKFHASPVFSSNKSKRCLKSLARDLKTSGALVLTVSGSASSASSFEESMPLCLVQAPAISHPSGSPQSQQPLTLVFSQVRWPSWSELVKQSRQIMHVGSFSQSSHFQATSPCFKALAHTPKVKSSSHICAITRSGFSLSNKISFAR